MPQFARYNRITLTSLWEMKLHYRVLFRQSLFHRCQHELNYASNTTGLIRLLKSRLDLDSVLLFKQFSMFFAFSGYESGTRDDGMISRRTKI